MREISENVVWDILLAIFAGVPLGITAYLAANFFQYRIAKKREGTPITWTKQCGDTIQVLPTKYSWAYCAASVLLMSITFFFNGISLNLLYVFAHLIIYLTISITDVKYHMIPNIMMLFSVLLSITWISVSCLAPSWQMTSPGPISSAIGVVMGFLVFYVGTVLTGGNVGFGDVKLAMAIGLMLGWWGELVAIAGSGFLMIPLVLTPNGKTLWERLKQLVPLGPPFSGAAMVILVAMFTPLVAYMHA